MRGSLELFNLADIVQLLASASKTGRLVVATPAGSTGMLYFEGGRPVHASYLNLEGQTAVGRLFEEDRGDFIFEAGVTSSAHSISVGADNLLLDTVRQLDEKRRGGAATSIEERIVPRIVDSVKLTSLTLDDQETAILAFVDGRTGAGEIARRSGLPSERVLACLRRLATVGLLELSGESSRVRALRGVIAVSRRRSAGQVAEVDERVLDSWSRALGRPIDRVTIARADGQVFGFGVRGAGGLGSRVRLAPDALVIINLTSGAPVLVRPQ
jgi:hypothetical protein